MNWRWLGLHTAIWSLLPLASALYTGQALAGLLAAPFVSGLVQGLQTRRWAWAPTALVGPVVGLLLFAGGVVGFGKVVEPPEDVTSLALDQVAVGVVAAGFLAPLIEALSQKAVLGSDAPRRFLSSMTLGSYVALGLGALALMGLDSLDLSGLASRSVAFTPANIAAVVAAGLIGGLRAGWLGGLLPPPDAG